MIKRLIRTLSIITILLTAPFLYGQQSQQLIIEAVGLYQMGQVDEAVSRLQLAISNDSTLIDAYVTLGQIYLETDRSKQAEEILRTALRYTMSDPRVHLALGIAHFEQHHFQDAALQFDRVLELDSENPRAPELLSLCYLNLGAEAYQIGSKTKALQQFERAVNVEPNNVDAHRNLAVVLYETDQPKKAKAQLLKGLELDPSDKDMLRMLIQLSQQQKDFEGALDAAVLLHRYYPNDQDAALQLAFLYRFNNQGDRAIELYQNLLNQFPTEKRIYDEFVSLYVARSQYDQAIGLYNELLAKTPGRKTIYEDIGRIYAEGKKYDESRAAYRNAFQNQNTDVDIYHKIAKTFLEEDHQKMAADVYREALDRFPDDWGLNRALGLVYENVQPNAALSVYRSMLQNHLYSPYPHVRLGVVYSIFDSTKLAMEHFQKAIELESPNPLPYHKLAEWAATNGDTTNAIQFERQATKKALQQLSKLKGRFLAQLEKSKGQIDLMQLDEMDEASKEVQTAQQLLRQSTANLLRLEKPDFLEADLKEWFQDYPEETVLLEYLGLFYEKVSLHDAALSTFTRLVRLDRKNKTGHLGMAQILEKKGMDNDAILAYKRALAIDSHDPLIYESLIRLYERDKRISRLANEWMILAKAESHNTELLKYLLLLLEKEERIEEATAVRKEIEVLMSPESQ